MRSLKLIAVLVPLLILVGCAKRTAKKPAANDETAAAKPQPSDAPTAGEDKKGAKGEESNWLNDPRFKKDGGPSLPVETPPNGKPSGFNITPPKEGWNPPVAGVSPMPAGGAPGLPAPPGMGVLQPEPAKPPMPAAVPTTPKYSPVSEADMKEVWVFIENASGASGKMPARLLTYQALVAAESKAAPLVKDGSIYLTGASTRESIWAFEMKALTSGGLVCSQNGVETLTAAELKKRLGK
ncbi:MAG: hypothetical protein J0I06_12190 [Planctomycetes bacterium]|nr:hypothetical protein [Planctomycetota bacterium]